MVSSGQPDQYGAVSIMIRPCDTNEETSTVVMQNKQLHSSESGNTLDSSAAVSETASSNGLSDSTASLSSQPSSSETILINNAANVEQVEFLAETTLKADQKSSVSASSNLEGMENPELQNDKSDSVSDAIHDTASSARIAGDDSTELDLDDGDDNDEKAILAVHLLC